MFLCCRNSHHITKCLSLWRDWPTARRGSCRRCERRRTDRKLEGKITTITSSNTFIFFHANTTKTGLAGVCLKVASRNRLERYRRFRISYYQQMAHWANNFLWPVCVPTYYTTRISHAEDCYLPSHRRKNFKSVNWRPDLFRLQGYVSLKCSETSWFHRCRTTPDTRVLFKTTPKVNNQLCNFRYHPTSNVLVSLWQDRNTNLGVATPANPPGNSRASLTPWSGESNGQFCWALRRQLHKGICGGSHQQQKQQQWW